MRLIEIFYQPLYENRVDFVKKNMGPKVQRKIEADPNVNTVDQHNSDSFIDAASTFDPTDKKLYTQWIVTQYLKDRVKIEDLYKIKNDLVKFEKFKKQLDKKDINQYKHPKELHQTVKDLRDEDEVQSNNALDRELKAGANKVYEDDEILVLHPTTEESSCYYGKGTQWCTAADRSNNMFDYYNEQGPLYIIIDKKTQEKWQWHFEDESYMDAEDEHYNPTKLMLKFPQLEQVFKKSIAKHKVLTPTEHNKQVQNAKTVHDIWEIAGEMIDMDGYGYEQDFVNVMGDMLDQNPNVSSDGIEVFLDMIDGSGIGGLHFTDIPESIRNMMWNSPKTQYLLPIVGENVDHMEDDQFDDMWKNIVSQGHYDINNYANILGNIENMSRDQWHTVLQHFADDISRIIESGNSNIARDKLAKIKQHFGGKVPVEVLQHYPPFVKIL